MSRKLFGTDGVRGVANIHPMTTEIAMQLGRAAAYIFKQNEERRHRVVIGKDTRLSGYMIENALAAGICSMGVDVLLVGPLPTPGIAFITSSMRADAGVVISASHNPYQDNGIKFFSRDGFKLPDEQELRIEELIFSNSIDALRPTADEVGKAFRVDDAGGRYIVFLKNTFPRDLDLEGLKIVLDCANGAAYKVAPAVLSELGAELVLLGVSPDGTNINRDCGSLHPEGIAAAVRQHGADLGIALDGDADRVIFVDEKGREIDGDHIMALCASDMIKNDALKQRTLVATVMSNMGLELALRQAGGRVVRTAVGDRYVVEEMRRGGYNLGGEQSGHMIFLDHNTTGDGMLSALQVLAIMQRRGRPLSELAAVMEALPQELVNVRVARKPDLATIPEIAARIEKVETDLAGRGRVLVRYSGTEPLLRIMIEGEDRSRIEAMAEDLASLVTQHIGLAGEEG
ncbi:MAG: phosphoglucosamine mutase [Geothermobacteraceae bacterium]